MIEAEDFTGVKRQNVSTICRGMRKSVRVLHSNINKMNSINSKTFEHRPISELMAIIKNDLRKLDDEGLIDEGTLIKTVKYCNDRLGINIREIKQACLQVDDYKTKLPLNFEKLYFVGGIKVSNSSFQLRDPFNNNFDRDVIYEADIDRGTFGNEASYSVTIKRETTNHVVNIQNLVGLDVSPTSHSYCYPACPNMRRKGRYTVEIQDDHLVTPFRCGEVYIMYLATMSDEEGNLLFPFHPMITPYYEWSIKEKVIMDAIFNSDGDYTTLLQLAQRERAKAWLDAYDMTTSKGFGEYVQMQKRKELGWYNQWFKYLQ
jgi:hypothetical protein